MLTSGKHLRKYPNSTRLYLASARARSGDMMRLSLSSLIPHLSFLHGKRITAYQSKIDLLSKTLLKFRESIRNIALAPLLKIVASFLHISPHHNHRTLVTARQISTTEFDNMGTRLCDLPSELLISIVNHINDDKTLCALARVSRRYLPFAEANIYKDILLRTSIASEKLEKCIEQRSERARLVQSVNLRPTWHTTWNLMGIHFMRLVKECHNLREFALESPTCNYGRWNGGSATWGVEEHGILLGLKDLNPQRLTKLTLHLDGTQQRYWNPVHSDSRMHSWAKVMTLPSISELTLSCAVIHEGISFGAPKSTSLRDLNLIECNITIKGFQMMLAAPRALEKLHLGKFSHAINQI